MAHFQCKEGAVGRIVAGLALAAAFFGPNDAHAAERTIPANAERFDCSSVKPGDTLTLPAGIRGPLTISNCKGDPSNRIVLRNDPQGTGPAIIRKSSGSGGWVFTCNTCIGFTIDGSTKWKGAPSGKTYGIQMTTSGGSPSAFLRLAGLSRFVTIRGVEVDGGSVKNGSGIRVNDTSVDRRAYPTLWREGILIEDNFVHHTAFEGMYVGPNYPEGDLPLRNIEIRNNRVEDTGFEGITTKSMWSGDNSIHDNQIRRAGRSTSSQKEAAQYSGISNISGTVSIYNNWVETTGQHGIQSWTAQGPKISENRGPFKARIWNNVIVDAGALWKSFMLNSYGINVGAQDGCEKPIPEVYSNTIVNARQFGIGLGSNVGNGFVRDNIVAGAGKNPVIKAPSMVDLINNRVGAVAQMGFANPGGKNFRLNAGSPARNDGTNEYPPTDHDGVQRPKDGASDQGAYEGTTGGG